MGHATIVRMAKTAKFTAQEVYLLTPEMAGRIADLADELGDSKSGVARIILGLGLKRYAELEAEDAES